jgi:sarcosine oxidase
MSDSYDGLQTSNSASRIVIIGAGIVGAALAKYLSDSSSVPIIVVDFSITDLRGSTGHAPGFVGQLNELPVLTTLAKDSVREYQNLTGAFDTVGGLEIASTASGIEALERRCRLAQSAGLSAKMISSAEAAQLAPHLHRADEAAKALYFPGDGTANARQIVAEYERDARAKGVIFLEAAVLSIETENGHVTGITTSVGPLTAERVVIATGIWTAPLLKQLGIKLPIIPVAHPYVHGPQRPSRGRPSPFVRWPERHVYARDHGSFDGFGSYDHAPIAVDALASTAIGAWDVRLDNVLARALSLFPDLMKKEEMEPFNGLFSVTPDGLPLAGPTQQVEGLWIASAVWVTHAAGVAKFVASMITGDTVDQDILRAVNPDRFEGRDTAELRSEALSTYNNIYNATD